MKRSLKFVALLGGVMLLILAVGCSKDEGGGEITVTDFDGNVYHGVKIGSQVWMKENLAVTHFRNGDLISTTNPANLDITNQTAPVYLWVTGNVEANAAIYGRLYTWYAAIDSRGICPQRGHIPSDDEWDGLIAYLGADDAGKMMRETGTTHWYAASEATNESGFTALPGDYRKQDGSYPGTIGFYAYWWTTSSSISNSAFYYSVDYTCFVTRSTAYKNHALSIRCIND